MSLAELGYAVRHPRVALSYLRMSDRIAELTGASTEEVRRYSNEPALSGITERVFENYRGYHRSVLGPAKKPRRAIAYYVICRILKPDKIVETGVQSGLSSSFLLQAMKENSKGSLYSVDLPDEKLLEAIPSEARLGRKSGWVVPEELGKNWKLLTGKSSDKLPALLDDLKTVDIFIHDSDHSFENMYWEFNTAWPYLAKNGMLLSDDIELNNAFDKFASEIKGSPVRLTHTIGGIRKIHSLE